MKSSHVACAAAAFVCFGFATIASAADDLLLADFEGPDYGAWKTEGTAFGIGPAPGTLPAQMRVEGFRGKGLANSFAGGDRSTGTLTSPEFKIERRYLIFLIGGGGHTGKTEMRLLIDGNAVRSAAGPNTEPGGSEALEPASWDVSEFIGHPAQVQIVDQATGGWGHINVDHLVQTDAKPAVAGSASRNLLLEGKFLHFPVRTGREGAPKQRVSLIVDGQPVREFEIELSDNPEWFAHLDVTAWHGKTATIKSSKSIIAQKALDLVTQANAIWAADQVYREPTRPQLHFSPRRGWLNDPNGLVFAAGEYHLYFQHNPYGWHWGNMHWGHAVSRDLIHWDELPIAIYPRAFGDWAFSGSAVVDKDNTSGWKRGDNDLLVGAYTSTGRGECIVYSDDRGRSWTEYEGNPVVKHEGRDPRLLWHAPSKQWVMALYSEDKRATDKRDQRVITFHTSPDLKTWTYQSRVPGFYECPDLFELPVDGNPAKRKWVLTAASSEYMVGTFDGKSFIPETGMLPGHRGNGFYAAQTFSSDPKGRVVQIGWMRASSPGMPFNQAMSLPLELSLRSTADGPRLAWTPVDEVSGLRAKSHRLDAQVLKPGSAAEVVGSTSELLEIHADLEPAAGARVQLNARGIPIVYDVAKQELVIKDHRVPAALQDGHVKLRIFTDRTFYEIFTNDGLTYVPLPVVPKLEDRMIDLSVESGEAKLHSFEVHELTSIWKPVAASLR
jgi:fructan beta-fructosidase